MNATTLPGTMLDHSMARLEMRAPVRAAAVGLAVVLTALAAQFTVPLPFTAVPLTLTPLVVMLTGAVLGSRLGFVTQALYLMAGAAGMQVFAPSPILPPGPLRLIGPTAGYLWAYPIAAFVTGWLAERGWDRSYWASLASMLAGLSIVFIGGVSWLVGLTRSVSEGIAQGFLPFILVDIIKVAIAALILPAAWKLLGANRGEPA